MPYATTALLLLPCSCSNLSLHNSFDYISVTCHRLLLNGLIIDSIVMTILLSPKTANYISLIGDIHYGSPNSHIYFTYIQPLFHYGKRLVSHRETNRFAI